MYSKFIILAIVFLVIELVILLWRCGEFIWKYWICRELDLSQRYGVGSWALITGASSGQGREFALELAKRGFNLILIGSHRTSTLVDTLKTQYPNRDIVFIKKNFAEAYNPSFFADIETSIKDKDVSILVNNVAHRTAWIPYHESPVQTIHNTIATGTYVQARLIHMLIGRMQYRSHKSAILNITAQCQHTTWGLGHMIDTAISVPYLSVYEASNAFGYYHSKSIEKEYGGGSIDILNITPGAVLTENTRNSLSGTPFSISAPDFVRNCLRLLGNWQGTTCAYWGHELSGFLINLAPWFKAPMLRGVGRSIAEVYMNTPPKTY